MRLRLPHPILLLLGGVAVAAVLTWVVPAGLYERRSDPATGRELVVAGTYARVEAAPVGFYDTLVAIPRGFAAGADLIICILIAGAAFVVVDRVGSLGRAVGAIADRFGDRGLLVVPIVSLFFGAMGAAENMQEEIIALTPVLLVLGGRLGVDATTVVAMSAGAAMVGSAFGPTNPFQAGAAMRVAQLPLLEAAALRSALLVLSLTIWVLWTLRHAARHRVARVEASSASGGYTARDGALILLVVLPILVYVYGALNWAWGFDQLTAGFLLGGAIAGLVGGLGVAGTLATFLEGMQLMLPAAMLVSLARTISVVLADGRVIDTILHALATPLAHVSGTASALLMIPFQAALHLLVTSVSGQAILSMPVMVPLSDLLGFPRLAAVMAFQLGAGLAEMVSPTNGVLLAVLLSAGVPFGRWVRFAAVGVLAVLLLGVAGMLLVLGGAAG